MKRLLILSTFVALTFGAASFGRGQSGGMKSMDMSKCMEMMGKEMKGMDMSKCEMTGGDKSGVKLHKGVGTVKKVDPAAGTVTLQHGPIKSLDWPAMTMAFGVKDKAMLGKLAAGKKVEFEFVKEGSEYVVTSIK